MKKITILVLLVLISTVIFAQKLEGTWTTTLDLENGPFTFFAEFSIDGDTLSGKLYNDGGSVKIYNTKMNGDKCEYYFLLNNNEMKHEGKLVNGELKIKTVSQNREFEFTMTRVKKTEEK